MCDIINKIELTNPIIADFIRIALKQYNIDDSSTYITKNAAKDFIMSVTEEMRNIYITKDIKLMDVV